MNVMHAVLSREFVNKLHTRVC